MNIVRIALALMTLTLGPQLAAESFSTTLSPFTEILFLSGPDAASPVTWEFRCEDGRGCGSWTSIPVPSNWELQGFGTYNYGHDEDKHPDVGHYRYRVEVPEAWRGRTLELVFDGVMTEAEVRWNGELAGEPHQGAFYRFAYDVTTTARFGAENLLEVTVREEPSDRSVDLAERDADYWVFGGIFRPVWLRALPAEAIDHVAVDARHGGSLSARVRLRGVTAAARLVAEVNGEQLTVKVPATPTGAGDAPRVVELVGHIPGVDPWSAETPNLYDLELRLVRAAETLHSHTERIGFRTVELRLPGDPAGGEERPGLYVNGHRVVLKGVNRHSFHPDTGRAIPAALDRADAERMKALNLNAVRMSHYPPDKAFLDAADELGLYVINELAGWHDAYSTKIGTQLVREMVERDVNHPSILFWANGNEDGWNEDLDDLYAVHDPQARAVIHPRGLHSGIDAFHYPEWDELRSLLDPSSWRNRWRDLWGELPLILPTEFLHGLYDGGGGAGLARYWEELRTHPRSLGGFLWVFTDEAVVRTDLEDGELGNPPLDADGNHAPDGILGPYREPSASAAAVREVFAPIHVEAIGIAADGAFEITVENRYDILSLEHCRLHWAWVSFPERPGESRDPGDGDGNGDGDGLYAGEDRFPERMTGDVPGLDLAPHQQGTLRLPGPPEGSDGLRLRALDPSGREVGHWMLPLRERWRFAARIVDKSPGDIDVLASNGSLELRAADVVTRFDLATGDLLEISRDGRPLPMGPSPRRAIDGTSFPVAAVRHGPAEDGIGYRVDAAGPDGGWLRWTFYPSGWLRLAWRLAAPGGGELIGPVLPLAETDVEAMRFLGQGPGRVWRNRREGGVLGEWTLTRDAATATRWGHGPKFAGYYAEVYWARLSTSGGAIDVVLEGDDLLLGLLAPDFPENAKEARAPSSLGAAGLALLHHIPAIGTKFHPSAALEPDPGDNTPRAFSGTIWLLPTGTR